ncbi:mobilization protein, partial [gut metagenome]
NPKTTQGEIFQKLKKQHAYIKKGVIYFDGKSRPLPPFMAKAIDRNNRISFIEKFRPTTEAEVAFLCKVFKVDRRDLVDVFPERDSKYAESVHKLHGIFNDPEVNSVRSALYEEGFIIRQEENTFYAIHFKN